MPASQPALDTVVIKQVKPVSRPPPISTRHELSVTKTAASGPRSGPKSRSQINLTNDVHPVFAERLLINGIQPEVVADVMRAASRFLLSPASLSFMHTGFFGRAEPVTNVLHGEEDMQSFEFPDAPSELTPQQTQKTLKALEKLAGDLVIGLCDSVLEETGKTVFPWLGGGAFIMMSRKGYEELKAAQEDGRQDDVAWLTFRIAMTLIHEIGRAACFVRNGLGHYHFAGSPVAEEGYKLVQRVFGGTMYLMPQGKPSSGGMGCNTPAMKIMPL